MILDLLAKKKKDFGVLEISSKNFLNECHRTSIAWTEVPNALCLAITTKYFGQALANENIRGIIAPPRAIIRENVFPKAVIVCERPSELFHYLHNYNIHAQHLPSVDFSGEKNIDPSAQIAETAILGENISIGKNVEIRHKSIILDNSFIKENSVIHENVIIGTQAKYTKTILGQRTHIEHYGGVSIGENCNILAGTNIARSPHFNECTKIGNNVHIGIQSSLGHDCAIGDNCDISSKVTISGRTRMGENCWVGAGAIVSNALTIGENASIKIGAVVIEDVPPNEELSGNFAVRHKTNLATYLEKKKRDI
jgi:UDP-3-O-[3-hydroxymyristoyl] glucosamine N-acyltransferase